MAPFARRCSSAFIPTSGTVLTYGRWPMSLRSFRGRPDARAEKRVTPDLARDTQHHRVGFNPPPVRCTSHERKMFFFEKKNQKTFTRLVPRSVTQVTSGKHSEREKVFCFFFSKKKSFLPSKRRAHGNAYTSCRSRKGKAHCVPPPTTCSGRSDRPPPPPQPQS